MQENSNFVLISLVAIVAIVLIVLLFGMSSSSSAITGKFYESGISQMSICCNAPCTAIAGSLVQSRCILPKNNPNIPAPGASHCERGHPFQCHAMMGQFRNPSDSYFGGTTPSNIA